MIKVQCKLTASIMCTTKDDHEVHFGGPGDGKNSDPMLHHTGQHSII